MTEYTDPIPKARRGDFMITFSGLRYWPLDPRPEDVRLEDIARALSMLCRFGGHTRKFYSVAQHSVLVCQHAPTELRAEALFHDSPEAYCVDIPRTIKHAILPAYEPIEMANARAIGECFGLELWPTDPRVKVEDTRAAWTEKRDVRSPGRLPWEDTDEPAPPWPEVIVPWSPEVAENAFLEHAHALQRAGLLRTRARA